MPIHQTARTFGARRVPELTAASGCWQLGEVTQARRDGIWPISSDPIFASVDLLLSMDGTNGSTTFTDSSANGLAITPSGNAQISTAQSQFGGASGLFDGSGDYLTPAQATGDYDYLHDKTTDYTIEMWIRPASVTGRQGLLVTNTASASSGVLLELNDDAVRFIIFRGVSGSFTSAETATGVVAANSWYFLSVVVTTSDVTVYVDGASEANASWTLAGSAANANLNLQIANGVGAYDGYIDDFRLTKAVRYAAAHTPPTEPFPSS